MWYVILVILLIGLAYYALPFVLIFVLVSLLAYIAKELYCYFYYRSEKFLNAKNSVSKHIKKCNELNEHIEELKKSYADIHQINYGTAEYHDTSNYRFRRPELAKRQQTSNVYNCSLSVCRNAQNQPFKYLCKYFNIKTNEECLAQFEHILNDFSAAEQGKELLKKEREQIVSDLGDNIPRFIRKYDEKRLYDKLGFQVIDFSQLYFPRYKFQYISAGGNSSMQCEVVMNVETLNDFVLYLGDLVKFRKSVAGQRALMTSRLREEIKTRDHYTCKKCHNSTKKEPNLLLEIDHIIPLSKGGVTEVNNLQTLCWRCNRAKGAKILSESENL